MPEFGLWKTSRIGCTFGQPFLATPLHLIGKGVQLLTSVTIRLLGSPRVYHSLQGGNPDQPPPRTELTNEHHPPGSIGVLFRDSYLAL